MKHYYCFVFIILMLSACSQEQPISPDSQSSSAPAELVLSVEYLADNTEVLKREEARCKNLSQSEALQDPVCQNVARVRSNLFDGYTDKGPPPKVLTELPAPH